MDILDSATASHVQRVLLLWSGVGLVWAHAVSRLLPVVLTRCLPYAGDAEHAKAKPRSVSVGRPQVLGTMASLGLVAVALVGFFYLGDWPLPTLAKALGASVLGVTVVGLWTAAWLKRRLGGFTGDTLGASQQLSEVAALLAWLAIVHPVYL
jgi:adenosylcobinamide-GDP ribazoletransferase